MCSISESVHPMVQQLTVAFSQKARSVQSALDIVKVVMETVEKSDAKGQEKMELLQAIIVSPEFRKIPLPMSLWQSIDVMIENDLLKPTVEMIVLASTGKLDINQSVVCCTTFLQKIFQKRVEAQAQTPPAPVPATII